MKKMRMFGFKALNCYFFSTHRVEAIMRKMQSRVQFLSEPETHEERIDIDVELQTLQMSRLVGKPTMWFSNSSESNQPVQSQKMARGLKFWI